MQKKVKNYKKMNNKSIEKKGWERKENKSVKKETTNAPSEWQEPSNDMGAAVLLFHKYQMIIAKP